jgi:hypothetical protein
LPGSQNGKARQYAFISARRGGRTLVTMPDIAATTIINRQPVIGSLSCQASRNLVF